jgi:osmotically-inducible protein OsmY
MKIDSHIQKDVMDELEFDPIVNAAHIGVAVENGIVTLSGHVSSFVELDAAEHAAFRVKGVRGVAQEIDVKWALSSERSDEDIAAGILDAFRNSATLPKDKMKVEVQKGFVTLYGELEWQYQSTVAERIARDVKGVCGLINNVRIKPSVKPRDVQQKIEQALKRRAELEASRIKVAAMDGTVTLSGEANSWRDKQAAREAAWSAPGVKQVVDLMSIGTA